MRLAVFAGPSLPVCDRPEIDGVAYLPPASRGDVERAARDCEALLLIDGVFHHDLAPTPKECYRAAQATRSFGAASMGALRAVECAPYGFLPLGAIAGWYRYERIDGDDEVAVAVDPRTQRALSVPSVNVRYVARLAQRRGILSFAQASALVEGARSVYYAERTWESALAFAPSEAAGRIRDIAEREGDLKRWDARFALRAVLRRLLSRKN